ncbi:hypothetical protein [Brasilonema bromeliae]|uniref:Transposase n=1 Tax=Brasilonema bromeliae SPC951 TaxID=385972 RepID=A0ABX1P8F9_9CYAN|nr:hypothetical protein [Brasilonema bromeliae]NMG20698.1 hypothetical protein [Brasilonema bromeliae SPC951]
MTQQPKLQQLKNRAFQLAQSIGLHCTQTKHFKKRFSGLDLRSKTGWTALIGRLQVMSGGVIPVLLAAA